MVQIIRCLYGKSIFYYLTNARETVEHEHEFTKKLLLDKINLKIVKHRRKVVYNFFGVMVKLLLFSNSRL